MQDTTVSITLYRYVGRDVVASMYRGYPNVVHTTVESSLTLRADNIQQLNTMVSIAAVDGWSRK